MEKFQISVKNLNNLWRFIEIYAVFVLNSCGEKSVWRKSLWRRNDNYEVCPLPQKTHLNASRRGAWHYFKNGESCGLFASANPHI